MGTSRMQNSADVSGPVLRYTNASQRNDLHHIATSTGRDQLNPQNVSLHDFPHPRSGGRANKKPPNLRIKIPSSDMIQKSQNTGDGNTIGIALGSPRLVDRRDGAPSYWAQQDPFARRGKSFPAPPVQRKPSKWQKIGGLFKARSAVTPKTSRSHYQVRNNRSPQGWSHSIDYQYPKAAGHSPDVEDRDSKSRRKAGKRRATEPPSNADAPCLEVEIPDFHMERYSVMFGGVFGQGKPSLIARRSKTLDEMISNSKTPAATLSDPEQEQCRKQTPPPRSRTPSFNLFPPTQTSKASKVLGTPNIPRGPSSLSRCQPLPTENEEEAEHLLGTPMARTPVTPRSEISELSMAHGGKQKAEYAHTDSPASSPVLSPLDRLVSPKTTPRTLASTKPEPKETQDQTKDKDGNDEKTKEAELPEPSANVAGEGEGAEPSPKIEISIARSVSVSKGEKKQVNIAAGSKNDRNDRLAPVSAETRAGKTESQVERDRILGTKGKIPKITHAYRGHRHGNSHDVQIETVSICSKTSLA